METKGTLSTYLRIPLIFVKGGFTNNIELFKQVYQTAFAQDWVTEDFYERIKKREEIFPTGIQLEEYGAAIPHTDTECIRQEFVAIITNREPLEFRSMEDKNKKVNADIVFVLGLNKPHAQLELLQSLINLLQDKSVLNQVLSASNSEELINVIKNNNF